jgi:hypothetical protein|tara:strand:+ start:8432 stop:8635 length:204 start_codon:yes stop_codon:yes gene_type:complete
MTLKRRLERLEQVSPTFYFDVLEMPTPVLEAILQRAYKAGEWPKTTEEQAVFRELRVGAIAALDYPA